MALTGIYDPSEERALFDRLAEGDEEAFTRVYQHFMRLLSGAILQLVKTEQDAAEVLQEAFLRVWLNRDKIPGIENPGGWVRRIVINECYRLLKKNGLRARVHNAMQNDTQMNAPSHLNAEHRLGLNETSNLIEDALKELSPRQHTIYKLNREQGKRVPEIAGQLNLSPDYVKKTLATALEKIRKKLRAAGKILPSFFLY